MVPSGQLSGAVDCVLAFLKRIFAVGIVASTIRASFSLAVHANALGRQSDTRMSSWAVQKRYFFPPEVGLHELKAAQQCQCQG